MNSKNLSIKEFNYELQDERISKYPLEKRDESKLLIYKNGEICEDIFFHLDKHLPKNSLLIFNNTKVVAARIIFEKYAKSKIEAFCLEPDENYATIELAMQQKQKVIWKCLIGGAKKWKEESLMKMIANDKKQIKLTAKKLEKINDYFLIEFSWNDDALSFSEILQLTGKIPLPPYLNREVEEKDRENYQTIFAKYEGSVAAPTAGLHFTERLFDKLNKKNIARGFITLHVGAGTFKPVKSETIRLHEMHAEFIEVKKEFIEKLLKNFNKDIIAVGTTSLRTIESLYWIGVKLNEELKIKNGEWKMENGKLKNVNLKQWEAYELPQNISTTHALENLLHWMQQNKLQKIIAKTQLMIVPGYKLKIVKALITNFHQPKSTLLLLVAAIVGDDWKKIYEYASQNNFRFLSYGDGSLIWKMEIEK
ncbi:MAG: S-adenosylmethionine:tRNA ribosyltransferase-isomerase [Chitinophagaceae bacterium]